MQKLLHILNEAPKYLIAAILVIVPLFPKFPLINIPGTYVAIRFEDILLLALAILTLVKVLPRLKSFLEDKLVMAFVIFFGIGLISVLCGAFLTETVTFSLGMLHLLRRVEYAIPLFACLTLLKPNNAKKDLGFFVKVLMVVTIVAFIYGLGQRYLRFPVIITQNEEYSKGIALFWTPGSHINSTFAGHYDLAAFMVMLLPIFITLIFVLKDKISKFLLLLTSGAGIWLLINSVSRIAQVSYLFAVFVALLAVRKFKALAVVLLVSLTLISMSSDLDARFMRVIQVYFTKSMTYVENHVVVLADEVTVPVPVATPIPVFEDRSTSIRLNVEWPRALRAIEKNPILGTGYSSITLATDNDYLRMLGETGILGFFAFFLIFFRIGKELLGALPLTKKFDGMEQGFLAGVIGAISGTFVTAVFIDIFEASKFAIIFWLILGYAIYIVRSSTYVEKN